MKIPNDPGRVLELLNRLYGVTKGAEKEGFAPADIVKALALITSQYLVSQPRIEGAKKIWNELLDSAIELHQERVEREKRSEVTKPPQEDLL